ncbi:cutinase family protein [Mycobacterium sp.]|uniref:cutinase family protein n=1 Tax=Mycobacterium sp. TaxID=1785 RepID=UPI003D0B1963
MTTWSAMLVPPINLGTASADSCPDVEVTFARGTSEPPGIGTVGEPFVDSLRSHTGDRSIAVYPVNYDASDDLVPSANAGAVDANAHVETVATSCPNIPSDPICTPGALFTVPTHDELSSPAHLSYPNSEMPAQAATFAASRV